MVRSLQVASAAARISALESSLDQVFVRQKQAEELNAQLQQELDSLTREHKSTVEGMCFLCALGVCQQHVLPQQHCCKVHRPNQLYSIMK